MPIVLKQKKKKKQDSGDADCIKQVLNVVETHTTNQTGKKKTQAITIIAVTTEGAC